MRLRDFIRGNRQEIDAVINQASNKGRLVPVLHKLNDSEREDGVMNNEYLYNMARRAGCKIIN
jgi:hypothetical protein